jgi:predicted nucleotidyltransferase component of viral defense system
MVLMKKKLSDKEWDKLAEKNAKHLAGLQIEVGNAEKVAEAFKDVSTIVALEHLFKLAEKYRRENKMTKTQTILEAVALIDRTGMATELVLTEKGTGKNQETALSVRRFTPAELFDSPIEYQEVLED